MERKAMKMRNIQRQQRLISDAGKLLLLAGQLQTDAHSGPATASPGMMKKTEEIEKLARSVKDKMRAP